LRSQLRRLFFEELAAQWDSLQDTGRAERLQNILSRFTPAWQKAEVILEVGVGTGALLSLVKELASHPRLIGVDLAAAMIWRAEQRGSGAGLCQADAHHLPFGRRSFPVIICHGVFPHFEDKPQALADLRRVLQPGGQLIILHDISREQVNAIHHELPSPLSDDLIPPASQMEAWLDRAGFIDVWVEDTPDYYLATARRLPQPGHCRDYCGHKSFGKICGVR
jgi:ubiquinone/menaquinone biosynthesis C-methylase UbiE